MCGIVGTVLRRGSDEPLVSRMVQLLRHRGPDEQRLYSSGKVTFGFARLSIIDPEQGHQPVFSEDGSVAVVCNGEIYNHVERRLELAKRAHRFNSNSDAEVVPHLYEEHQENFVGHLHGMFALALYDSRAGKVVLARDALGIKPLYYLCTEEGLYFSSEFKCFLLAEEYKPEVDRQALDQLLAFKHIPGENCLLKNVRVLAPGHMLVFDLESFQFYTAPYYHLPEDGSGGLSVSLDEAKAEVCRIFDEAVKMRLMSDVPLGVSLSGGLDSSAVAASVARQLDRPPKTFSVYLGDTINELSYARMVADRYKTDHHELTLEPEALPTLVPKVLWHIEEPISVSEISTYYLGMAVKKYVTVLLCGEGSDELFGGYVRFQPMNLLSRLPKALLSWGYIRGLNGFTRAERARLYSKAQKPFLGPNSNHHLDAWLRKPGDTVLNRLLRYELTQQLPRHQLMRLDKLTMAHAVEARVPFLDTDLIAYVSRLPSRFKVRGFREKVLLKLAMMDRLPEPIIRRRKYGFSNPVKALLRSGFRDICHDELRAHKDVVERYFSFASIERLFDNIGKGFLTIPEQKLFHIYLFVKWHQLFVEGSLIGELDPVIQESLTA
ncbi:MAG: asparagine synthase (glutamine-hydrolyzing) [Calditrichaeota bacterium]|nr:MAG: asparagine synthase (glutamine-hydrolyzing) [Calditrichota bacterium]